jgi:hypothetical protein
VILVTNELLIFNSQDLNVRMLNTIKCEGRVESVSVRYG